MKVIWSIVGILIIVIVVAAIYKSGQKNNATVVATVPESMTPSPVVTAPVTREVQREVVVVPINYNTDCRTQDYRDRVAALLVTYNTARAAYQNAIATSAPNAIELYKAMNVAYNAYYNERRKCLVII